MWANTQPHGGLIVIGVENDGTVSGCLSVGTDKNLEFEQAGSLQCHDARFDTSRIKAKRADGSADFLLLLRVYYRPDKLVETVRSEAFIRSGKSKRQLSEDEKREIQISKGQIEYEKEPVLLKYPQDFDELLIGDFCAQYKTKRGLTTGHDCEQILCLNHLGALRDGKFMPNLAGALLFALDPRQVVPGARIRFMKFEGMEEKTGQQYNCVKDIFVEGPLPRMIQESEDIISGQIRNFTRLGKDSKFYTRPEYPADVWLEAVVNACVHRSYNLKNMNIFVKMFDDRLVVESPGGFPPVAYCVVPGPPKCGIQPLLRPRWGLGTYHGLRRKHVDTYLDEFVFRYNRRFYRHASFEKLLGLTARHAPSSYWDIVGRANPRKGEATTRRAPRHRKTAVGMRRDGAGGEKTDGQNHHATTGPPRNMD